MKCPNAGFMNMKTVCLFTDQECRGEVFDCEPLAKIEREKKEKETDVKTVV